MRLYSDYPARRTLQIIADLLAIGLIAIAVWLGLTLYAFIAVGAEFGRSIQSTGANIEQTMTDAASNVSQTPLIGDGLAAPLLTMGTTGTLLVDLGVGAETAVLTAAGIAGFLLAAVIVVLVLWVWLPRRIRFARRATEAWQLARLADGPDLLALRALVSAKRSDLATIDEQPVAAWRRGDTAVIRALATVELRGTGVRPPSRAAR